MTIGPGALADVLGALPVYVETVEVRRRSVPVADYEGGGRPSSVVLLSGRGETGRGENVAFVDDEQARFAARAAALLAGGAFSGGAWHGPVEALVDAGARGYERAALEAALIDSALRQASTTLAALAGGADASLRVVVSFAARPDPAAHVRRLRAAGRREELKVDVDPTWDDAACTALAAEPGIAILDFKGRGDARLAKALSARFPDVLFEDPPDGSGHARIARDATLSDAADVAASVGRGESVNLKAPRMGGPLEVLRGLESARRSRQNPAASAYVGGMFEVDVGRRQARQLAALFCPDGPNDLAPFQASPEASSPAPSPASRLAIRFDAPGFG